MVDLLRLRINRIDPTCGKPSKHGFQSFNHVSYPKIRVNDADTVRGLKLRDVTMQHSLSRRTLLTALIAVPFLAEFPFAAPAHGGISQPVTKALTKSDRFYGSAARIEQIRDEAELSELIRSDCTCLTPEIHLKWNSIENKKGSWWFEPVDDLVSFAASHGMSVRGHTLIWDQSTPDWAKTELLRERDWALVERYFAAVIARYRDAIEQWDVVNEPIDTENGRNDLRRTTFHRAFGPTYIEQALWRARAHVPQGKLMINDYGFDYDNHVEATRRKAFLKLVERLKRDGVPIDGVGIQAHLDLSKGRLPDRMIGDFLAELGGMGLDVVITELDVKEADLNAPLATRNQRVADEVRHYLDIALAEPAVSGVVTWGLSDRHSWLQSDMGRDSAGLAPHELNRGLPYDATLDRKPMYFALHDALGRPANA